MQQAGEVHAKADRVDEAQGVQALWEALREARREQRAVRVADDGGAADALGVERGGDRRRRLVDRGDARAGCCCCLCVWWVVGAG